LRVAVVLRLADQSNQSVHSINSGLEIARAAFQAENPTFNVELIRFSHNDTPESVRTAAQRVADSGIAAAIGGEWSTEALVLGQVLNAHSIVLITPTASNPQVTLGKPYVFRMCFTDDTVATGLAKFTIQELRPKVVGVLHNASSPYSDYLTQTYVHSVLEMSSALAAAERPALIEERIEVKDAPEYRLVNTETLDLKPQIEHFKQAHTTHVALLGFQSDLLPFIEQSNMVSYHPVFIGSDGWGSDKSLVDAAKANNVDLSFFKAYRNYYWDQNKTTSVALKFRADYLAKYHAEPNGLDAIGFDTAWLLLQAMKSADRADASAAVREALLKTKIDLVTAAGFEFEEGNSPTSRLQIYEIKGGSSRFLKTLE
jgi:branched-chain amino acid transport system substrate-binding protein